MKAAGSSPSAVMATAAARSALDTDVMMSNHASRANTGAVSSAAVRALGEAWRNSSPQEREALDEWRAGQVPDELALVNRFIRDVRRHGKWARAYRSTGYYTAEDLDAFFDDYAALLAKHGHTAQDIPPGARLTQLRMFYIPDEPAGKE